MKRWPISLLISVQLMMAVSAFSLEIREPVPTEGEVIRGKIIVFESGSFRELEGVVSSRNGVRYVSADVDDLSNEALVGGLIQLTNGKVASSPLHRFDSIPLASQSSDLALETGALIGSRDRAQEDIKELGGELYLSTLQARRAAGLSEVDRLREQAEWLEAELAQVRAARSDWAEIVK